MTRMLYHNSTNWRAPLASAPEPNALNFHQQLPGYTPTRLVSVPNLAAKLDIEKLWVKDESRRLGLPSFKILGASWATYRALATRLGDTLAPWSTLSDFAAQLEPLRPLTLVAATDGNHGRAVAHMAALLGLDSRIFVPADMAPARIAAIRSEGATVVQISGSYDDAVRISAAEQGERALVISDTSWPGYEQVPGWVIDGYSTIFREADDALAATGEHGPNVVVVQMGVGALAAAVVRHYRRPELVNPPTIIGVEPLGAACILASMQAGKMVEVPGPHRSIMAGLNCGLPSELAWPLLSQGINLFIAVEDEQARQAMRLLAAEGIVAGETGAAGVAGLLELLGGADAAEIRARLGITPQTRVLAICTEGATDPAAYQQIVGHPPPDS